MNLWLLRHAKAVPEPPAGGSDHDRPLAPRGRRDADALGKLLADPGFGSEERPALVLCSSASRTAETAQRVLASLDDPPPVEYRRALYGASPDDVLDQLRGVEEGIQSVMVVGHNPTAHDLVTTMERDPPAGRPFPTCALAVYRLPIERWSEVARGTATLLGLYAPPY